MKTLPKWLLVFLPALYLVVLAAMFLIKDVTDKALFLVLGIYVVLGFVAAGCGIATCAQEAFPSSVKWIIGNTAANLLLFLGSLIYLGVLIFQNAIAAANGAMEGGLAVFLWILLFLPHRITYSLTRIVNAVCCAKATKTTFASSFRIFILCMMLLPVLDMIAVILVNRKWKQTEMHPATSD